MNAPDGRVRTTHPNSEVAGSSGGFVDKCSNARSVRIPDWVPGGSRLSTRGCVSALTASSQIVQTASTQSDEVFGDHCYGETRSLPQSGLAGPSVGVPFRLLRG